MKPSPKPLHVVCSVCDQPWENHRPPTHGAEPGLEECIRLLKAKSAYARGEAPTIPTSTYTVRRRG